MQNTMISSSTVVSGEASETDEEDEEDEEKHKGTRHKPETAVVYDHSSHGNLKTEQVAHLDDAETQEAWSEDPRAIKSKGQKIIYKFDSWVALLLLRFVLDYFRLWKEVKENTCTDDYQEDICIMVSWL